MLFTGQTRRTAWLCVLLSAVTLATYWPVTRCQFVNYDDTTFVVQNARVTSGLNWANVAWACRTSLGGNWEPLTWVSHMLATQMFGLRPGWHHLVNLLFHTANALLLFLLLERMTEAAWRSAAVAGLFALHPLHVESVAWVAERKDVLSGFFFMLTLLAYVRHVECRRKKAECRMAAEGGSGAIAQSRSCFYLPASGFYWLSLACFTLGLMSKPMLVTVPFVLLLLDFWPLGRLRLSTFNSQLATLLEKLPFFALSAASCVLTLNAQRASESILSLDLVPLPLRAANALVAGVTYLKQTFWPAGLAVFYQLPRTLPAATVIVAAAVVLATTLWAIWSVRRSPFVAFGWCWFMGMLVPVIGLVQVGLQQRADRYTYLPLIGLFVLVVWGAHEALGRARPSAAPAKRSRPGRSRPSAPSKPSASIPAVSDKRVWGVVAGLVLLGCAALTRAQLQHWRTSESLFRQAIAVTSDNWLAHYNLAQALSDSGRSDEAVAEYRAAVAAQPRFARAHNNLAGLLLLRGQADEAIAHLKAALEAEPGLTGAHYNLGKVLLQQGNGREAAAHLQKALELEPDLPGARTRLGNALLLADRSDEAAIQFQEAERIARSHSDLAASLLRQGRFEQAVAQYEAAAAEQPENPAMLSSVAWVLATCPSAPVRNGPQALRLALKATGLRGGQHPPILRALAAAYAEIGRFADAVSTAQRALNQALIEGDPVQVDALRAQLASYELGKPFRDPALK